MPFRYPDILLYYQTRQSRNRMFARYGLSLSFGKDGHRFRALPQCADLGAEFRVNRACRQSRKPSGQL
jgi:hypothetical protein